VERGRRDDEGGEHRHRRAGGDSIAEPVERRSCEQRGIGKHDQQSIRRVDHRVAGRKHGMRRAASFLLHEHIGSRYVPVHRSSDILASRSDHDRNTSTVSNRLQDMVDQGSPAERVQHFRTCGAHAGALAGGENDREASPCVHRVLFRDATS
jgi:hypothetical protein